MAENTAAATRLVPDQRTGPHEDLSNAGGSRRGEQIHGEHQQATALADEVVGRLQDRARPDGSLLSTAFSGTENTASQRESTVSRIKNKLTKYRPSEIARRKQEKNDLQQDLMALDTMSFDVALGRKTQDRTDQFLSILQKRDPARHERVMAELRRREPSVTTETAPSPAENVALSTAETVATPEHATETATNYVRTRGEKVRDTLQNVYGLIKPLGYASWGIGVGVLGIIRKDPGVVAMGFGIATMSGGIGSVVAKAQWDARQFNNAEPQAT